MTQGLRMGYRLVDTAQADEWYNEADAGTAVRLFIAESNGKVSRDDIWVTTKASGTRLLHIVFFVFVFVLLFVFCANCIIMTRTYIYLVSSP